MPPERRQPQKSRQLPFKPPRPQTSTNSAGSSKQTSSKSNANSKSKTQTKTSAPPKKRPQKSTGSRQKSSESPVEISSDSASEAESVESRHRSRESSASSGEPDYILAEVITNNKSKDDVTSSEPTIPPKLLTRLLHHNFQNEKTKIAKDANEVVAKYVDIFVRESLARAAYERNETESGANPGVGGTASGDGFLEVEDLEKMAPQLLLDF